MPDDDMRFADQELIELRRDFERHEQQQETSLRLLATMVEQNTRAIERIAAAVEGQNENTAGIVQLYADIKGVARVGVGVQKFLAWLAAFGAVGAAIVAAVMYVLDRFTPPGGP